MSSCSLRHTRWGDHSGFFPRENQMRAIGKQSGPIVDYVEMQEGLELGKTAAGRPIGR